MKSIILSILLLFGVFFQANAQKEKIQSAYIYQFTKLIDWCPSGKTGNFVIGVLGNASINSELTGLSGKKVGTQAIEIKTFATVAEIDKCNLLFIPSNKSNYLNAVNKKIGKNCILVITEKYGLAKEGASINFIEEGGKIAFELNKTSLSDHSFTVNVKLMSMAKAVYQLNE